MTNSTVLEWCRYQDETRSRVSASAEPQPTYNRADALAVDDDGVIYLGAEFLGPVTEDPVLYALEP